MKHPPSALAERRRIYIPVSVGELLDRTSILSIKLERIRDREKRDNVRRELQGLTAIMEELGIRQTDSEFLRLKAVNLDLWQLEDAIRDREREQRFDQEFIELARRIYQLNDERAALKKAVDRAHGSELTEEKEYSSY